LTEPERSIMISGLRRGNERGPQAVKEGVPPMRIGIVNDVFVAREALRRVVTSSPEHEVVWIASHGEDAILRAREDRPDLILMDLFMPGVDGVEATRRIMSESPCAILVVTSTVTGNLREVYEAMGHGALDAIDTPTLGLQGEIASTELLLNKIKLIGKLIGKGAEPPRDRPDAAISPPAPRHVPPPEPALEPLIVLGASTGGPHALAEILSHLPATFDAGIIIIQLVDSMFASGLGEWLSKQAGRRVALIDERHRPGAGEILVPRTNDHVVLGEDRRLHYSIEPRMNYYRPSVDVFFASAARNWARPGVAVLLTGVGRDGAEGLLQLRKLGWRTIAQDPASSVVGDMPRAAVELGAAEEVLPLSQIAEAITRLAPAHARRGAGL
jgi:two-component system, chemotaxis family, response regulator WspF